MIALQAYSDLDSASEAALAYLQQRLGFKLWITTRVSGSDWVVLNAADQHYGVSPGRVFQWSDSYCYRMMRSEGPHFAPSAADVAAYSAAAINKIVPIKAYMGVPIMTGNGELFGTLCAIDPEPKSAALESEVELVQMVANMLGLIAEQGLQLAEQERLIEQIRDDSERDELTGLMNIKGWNRLMHQQESVSRRYGSPMCILIIDLDGLKNTNDELGHEAGDRLLVGAADCLDSTLRTGDIAARIGGDEFAIFAAETGHAASEKLYSRLIAAFEKAGINMSIGLANHNPHNSFAETLNAADAAMYKMKTDKQPEPAAQRSATLVSMRETSA